MYSQNQMQAEGWTFSDREPTPCKRCSSLITFAQNPDDGGWKPVTVDGDDVRFHRCGRNGANGRSRSAPPPRREAALQNVDLPAAQGMIAVLKALTEAVQEGAVATRALIAELQLRRKPQQG